MLARDMQVRELQARIEITGVICDTPGECVPIRRVACVGGEREAGEQRLHALIHFGQFRQRRQQLRGLVVAIERHQQVGAVDTHGFIGGIEFRSMAKHAQRAFSIFEFGVFAQGFLAQLFRRGGNQAIEELTHLRFRQRAGEFIDQRPVNECFDIGNAAHAVALRQRLVFVGVDFRQSKLARVFRGQFFKHRL